MLHGAQKDKQEVRHCWEWSSKPSTKHFNAISNTKACPHLTYPTPIVGKKRAEQEERASLEVGRASRQPEQGSLGGKGDNDQVIQYNDIKS